MSQQTLTTLLQEARLSYSQQDYPACLALLNDCLLLSPAKALLLSNRALAHYRLGMLHQALADLNSAIQTDPLSHVAYFNLFSVLHLQQAYEEAFFNLVFALSSACTLLGRQQKDPQLVEKAILYSYNNKEALLLRGLLHLQHREIKNCLQMLSLAHRHESSPVTRLEIQTIVSKVAQKNTVALPELSSKNVGGKPHALKSTLKHPSKQNYSATIKPMLQEFSRLHSLLRPNGLSFPFGSRETLFNDNSLRESELKEDRTNCMTAHNSTLGVESDSHIGEDPHLSRGSCTLFADSTHHLNRSSSHSVIPEQSSSIADNWSESLPDSSKSQPPSPLINFRAYWAQLSPEKDYQHLYLVCQYMNPKGPSFFRTPLAPLVGGVCQWQAVSEAVGLAVTPAALVVRVYDKRWGAFEDERVGEGELRVDRVGTATVGLENAGVSVGKLVVGVTLAQQ